MGENWDAIPYEHHAKRPFLPTKNSEESWEILEAEWIGPFDIPADFNGIADSNFSVLDINAGLVPWMKTQKNFQVTPAQIMSGASPEEFSAFISSAGGRAYIIGTLKPSLTNHDRGASP